MKDIKTDKTQSKVREFRRKIKEHFGSLYDEVTAILYRHDPAYLAMCGVPPNEYAGETSKILPQLKNVKSASEARIIIYDVFDQSFNHGYSASDLSTKIKFDHNEIKSESDFELIAEEVWVAWKEFQSKKREVQK